MAEGPEEVLERGVLSDAESGFLETLMVKGNDKGGRVRG